MVLGVLGEKISNAWRKVSPIKPIDETVLSDMLKVRAQRPQRRVCDNTDDDDDDDDDVDAARVRLPRAALKQRQQPRRDARAVEKFDARIRLQVWHVALNDRKQRARNVVTHTQRKIRSPTRRAAHAQARRSNDARPQRRQTTPTCTSTSASTSAV